MYVIEYRPQQIDYWNKTLKMLTTCCLGSPLLVGPVWRCQPMQRKKEGRPADTLPGASSSQGPKGVSCGTLRGMKIKPGSIGKGIPRLRRPGNTGIRMKPTKPIGLFMGYEDNPVKTAEVACGDFYNSGDRATMDEEGYIWFLGRNDDIINASGYRIGPAEVENALAEHPAVAESAVVSSLDPIRREVRRRTQRSSCLCVGTKAGAGKPSSRSCLSNLGPRVEGGPRGVHVHLHCVATREQCGLNHV
nr:acyl-coenzyme A synthetase ACSM1, mitochondrial-like isoform X5 [Halichoerus grypus]XP_035920721.1 acyl-coenzyme A synthetase ACSM1, mitochondrial-like isoform X5 [Halichoerus grypus]XP_035920731.1 acyl-coenzyme A synthetase ACSM1, mitochondrial-like isoform X5 [Halichoerus grypus]